MHSRGSWSCRRALQSLRSVQFEMPFVAKRSRSAIAPAWRSRSITGRPHFPTRRLRPADLPDRALERLELLAAEHKKLPRSATATRPAGLITFSVSTVKDRDHV